MNAGWGMVVVVGGTCAWQPSNKERPPPAGIPCSALGHFWKVGRLGWDPDGREVLLSVCLH